MTDKSIGSDPRDESTAYEAPVVEDLDTGPAATAPGAPPVSPGGDAINIAVPREL